MTPSNRASAFRLGDDITNAMERLFRRDGISPSEQARRALMSFLEKKGVLEKPKKAERPQRKNR
jgi:hypothetical protein